MPESEKAYEAPIEARQGEGSASETYGATCPECGGSIRVREGERSVECGYCGSALCVATPRGFRGYYLPPEITAGRARLEALKYLSKSTGGRVKARHASILDVRLIHVPFWRMSGRLAGWICGERVTTRQVETTVNGPHGPRTEHRMVEERAPYSKIVFKRVDWSTPACSLRHLGLQGISLRARTLEWEVFDHELKKTMNIALPMKSRAEAERDGFNYLTGLLTPAGGTVRARRFRLTGSDFSVYYYPVYMMRYRHREIIYSITVDANDGRVVRGGLPEFEETGLKSLFLVPAAAAVLVGTWAPLLPIAAGALYVYDILRGGRLMMPHEWLAARLASWFGGGRR